MDAQLLAGILLFMVTHMMPDEIDDNLTVLWAEIKEKYVEFKSKNRLGALTKSMIIKGSAVVPCLNGPRGAQIQDLLPIVRVLFIKHMGRNNLRHRDMLLALTASCKIEEILFSCHGLYALPPREAYDFSENCSLLCKAIVASIKKCDPSEPFFNFTIKTHQMIHFGITGEYMNPQMGSCYDGEVLMGIVRKLVQGVARGSKPLTVSNNALQRYLHALFIDVQNAKGLFR